MNHSHSYTLIFFILMASCLSACDNKGSSLELAAFKCDELSTQKQISECKEKKQQGREYYLSEATKLLLQDNRYESLDLLEKAIQLDPHSERVYFDKGLILASLGEANDAIAHFNKAITIKPEMADAYFHKALALTDLHKYQEAIKVLEKTVKIKPDHALAHYSLGVLLIDAQKTDAAHTSFINAYRVWENNLKDNPGFFIQQERIKQKYNKTRRYLQAIGYLNKKDYRIADNPDAEDKPIHLSNDKPEMDLPTDNLWKK
ncbi:MAG: tetratricopeptide repeat protein [Deltaproteobacteria bacterium]|nr:tetratricopeptide repeat protein [Deltaproteobacteria bacterium]